MNSPRPISPLPSPATPGRAAPLARALSLTLALLTLLSFHNPAHAQLPTDIKPEQIEGLELTNRQGQALDLTLTFQRSDGSTITLADLFDAKRPVAIQMLYLGCPLLCPKSSSELLESLNAIDLEPGKDFKLYFISFDPRDTPPVAAVKREELLLEYRRLPTKSTRDAFDVLTASPVASRALAEQLGFGYRYLPESREFAHGAAVFIVTPDGKLSRTLSGLEYPVNDLRLALIEASNGKIGTIFDQFTLWCYHFDPNAGAYVLKAFRLMQIGGAATAIAIAALLTVLFRHERRRRRLFMSRDTIRTCEVHPC